MIAYQGNENEDTDGCRINQQTQQCEVDPNNNQLPEPAVPGISKRLIGSSPPCDCYQSLTCPITNPPGAPSPICTQIPTGAIGSVLYQEIQRDVTRSWYLAGHTIQEIETTAPHELGHQFGLLGDQVRTTLGIMDYSVFPSMNSIQLHPEHINIIRRRVKSPGQ